MSLARCFILCFIFFPVSSATHAQTDSGDSYTLKGDIKGISDGIIKLSYSDVKGNWVVDSVNIENGHFQINGKISEPTFARLQLQNESDTLDELNQIFLFLEIGDMMVHLVHNNFKDAIVKGSRSHSLLSEHEGSKEDLAYSIDSLKSKLSAVRDSSFIGSETERKRIVDDLIKQISGLIDLIQAIDLQFVKHNKDEVVSAFLLWFHVDKMDIDTVEYYYNYLDPLIQNTHYGKEVSKKMFEAKNIAVLNVGDIAPNFLLTDSNGISFSLDSLWKDSFVILDLWATWCIPCMEMAPLLQEISEQYANDELRVVGVSFDFNEQKWKSEISKNGNGKWKHALLGVTSDESKDFIGLFNIASIPAYILIKKGGIVLGKYEMLDREADSGLFVDLEKYLREN
ncbi:TlpA disulfide reductase family protein [Olivibacter sitiensis]|uniref:TlpA disulfide reductase family protein n=1 Tax=Olivibacter sitiensis TaxID=376470 RepID=UPI000414C2B0|nr:TlpA disulfide reductase family protein [Olivibacter sitiensis]